MIGSEFWELIRLAAMIAFGVLFVLVYASLFFYAQDKIIQREVKGYAIMGVLISLLSLLSVFALFHFGVI